VASVCAHLHPARPQAVPARGRTVRLPACLRCAPKRLTRPRRFFWANKSEHDVPSHSAEIQALQSLLSTSQSQHGGQQSLLGAQHVAPSGVTSNDVVNTLESQKYTVQVGAALRRSRGKSRIHPNRTAVCRGGAAVELVAGAAADVPGGDRAGAGAPDRQSAHPLRKCAARCRSHAARIALSRPLRCAAVTSRRPLSSSEFDSAGRRTLALNQPAASTNCARSHACGSRAARKQGAHPLGRAQAGPVPLQEGGEGGAWPSEACARGRTPTHNAVLQQRTEDQQAQAALDKGTHSHARRTASAAISPRPQRSQPPRRQPMKPRSPAKSARSPRSSRLLRTTRSARRCRPCRPRQLPRCRRRLQCQLLRRSRPQRPLPRRFRPARCRARTASSRCGSAVLWRGARGLTRLGVHGAGADRDRRIACSCTAPHVRCRAQAAGGPPPPYA
jgi:hypothetical protein